MRFRCGYTRANGGPCAAFVKADGERCSTHSDESLRLIAAKAIAAEVSLQPRIAEMESHLAGIDASIRDARAELRELQRQRSDLETEIRHFAQKLEQPKTALRCATLLDRAEAALANAEPTREQFLLSETCRELARELRLFSAFAATVAPGLDSEKRKKPLSFNF